ncbi:MAG: glycosyltransferase family 4 protein [Bacteroidales bacterium]
MNKPVRHIAFVISCLKGGGAERVISGLANYFVNLDYKVSVIYLDKHKDFYFLDEKINRYQIEYSRNIGNFFLGLINTRKRILAICKMIQKVNPEIVISFITDINVLTVLACRNLNVPVIISERTNPGKYQIPRRWKIAARLFYPLADKMILQTDRAKKYYNYLPSSKIAIVPNPVFKRAIQDNVEKEKIILAVGRLEYPKGFDLLIQAFSKTQAKKDWQLIIAGEGSERQNLEGQIMSCGLDSNVSLVGFQLDIENFYSRASLFALSSRYEGYPNALAEAMNFGLPCISFNCDFGPAEMIKNGENGILIEPGNTEQLARGIDNLINDSEKRDRLGKNAAVTRKDSGIRLIAKKWETIFDDLCSW